MAVKRLIAFLDKQKQGKLFNSREIALTINLGYESFGNVMNHPALRDYRIVNFGRTHLWGSKKTIETYEHEFGKSIGISKE